MEFLRLEVEIYCVTDKSQYDVDLIQESPNSDRKSHLRAYKQLLLSGDFGDNESSFKHDESGVIE